MDGKTTAFATEISRLYEKINSNNNQFGPKIDALLAAYGLTLPLTQVQLDAMTPMQRGQIMAAIAPALAAIGNEVQSATWKTNLLGIGAYATPDDLKGDISNLVPANSVAIATTDIDKLVALTALIDSLFDGAFVFQVLDKVLSAKDSLADTATNFSKV